MSDGMRDTAAMSALQRRIERAALELRVAIQRAQDGHRGTAIANSSIVATINEQLRDTDFILEKRP